MNNRLFMAAALAATAMTGVAIAAQDTPSAAMQGAKKTPADANRDGVITRAEILAQADAQFKRLDADGDGQIYAEERTAMRGKRGGGMKKMGMGQGRLAQFDTDGDGQISAEERGEAREAMKGQRQARLDTDNDGTITDAERATAKASRTARRAQMTERMDANNDGTVSAEERAAFREARQARRAEGGEGPRMGRRGGGQRGAAMLARVDTNGDGMISRDEHRAAAVARFTAMDANQDGRVDAAERQAHRAERQGRRAEMRAQRDAPVAAPTN